MDVTTVHERYLRCCNEHRLDELGEYVSPQVSGSGPAGGLAAYVEGVKAVVTGFPDLQWELLRVVRDALTTAQVET